MSCPEWITRKKKDKKEYNFLRDPSIAYFNTAWKISLDTPEVAQSSSPPPLPKASLVQRETLEKTLRKDIFPTVLWKQIIRLAIWNIVRSQPEDSTILSSLTFPAIIGFLKSPENKSLILQQLLPFLLKCFAVNYICCGGTSTSLITPDVINTLVSTLKPVAGNLTPSESVTLQYYSLLSPVLSETPINELYDSFVSKLSSPPSPDFIREFFQVPYSNLCEVFTKSKKVSPRIIEKLFLPNKPQLSLIKLPLTYKELVLQYYTRPCSGCNGHIDEKGLCLVCGTVVCLEHFLQREERNYCSAFANHSIACQLNSGAYLRMRNGGVIMYYKNFLQEMESPYRTKFGESMTLSRNQEEEYTLSESAMNDLESMVKNGKISAIMRKRMEE